jgi:CheY-like chemotaxis protein
MGYYLIERIRTLAPEDGCNVRAIALTAFASPVDRAKALASGFEAFLSKPVDPAVLVSGIAKLAGRPSH